MKSIHFPDQTLAMLGEGGMARVYRVQHLELGEIAVKVMRQSDDEAWRRLRREATAQARLSHPNICRVHGFGEYEGKPAILMQYIRGRSFEAVASEISLEARIRLLVDVCDAMEHAHAAGLVHRDLKPSNILVEERDAQLHPFVLDFGLVRDARDGSLTRAGDLLGTPAFMSPEQARGDARGVDRRSDIFSLGCILYTLLIGRPPFQAESVQAVLGRILSEEAPLAHRVDRSVPLPLSRVCAQCLERERERRYPSARALREDLQRWLQGESPQARSLGWRYRSGRWLRRNPALAVSLGLALLVGLGALIHADQSRRKAEQHERLAVRLTAASETLRSRMRIAQMAPPQPLDATAIALGQSLDQLEREAAALTNRGGFARRALARAWLDLDRPERALHWLPTPAQEPQAEAEDLHLLAEALVRRFEHLTLALGDRPQESLEGLLDSEARELRSRATRTLERAAQLAPSTPPAASARLALLQGRFDAALDDAESYVPVDLADYTGLALQGEVLSARARAALREGDQEAAERSLVQALQRYDSALATGRNDARLMQAACRSAADAVRLAAQRADAPPASPGRAHPACDTAIQVRPDREESYVARALAWSAIATAHGVLDAAGEEHKALLAMRDDAQRAVALAPLRPEPALLLARAEVAIAQLRLGSLDEVLAEHVAALARIEAARAVHPHYAPLLQQLALLQRGLGRVKSNHQSDPRAEYGAAIGLFREALALQPESVALIDQLSLTYVFAFYEERARDPGRALEMGRLAIDTLDAALQRQPRHPDLLATQASNYADLWSYLNAIEAEVALGESPAALRQQAVSLFARLREVAPQRPDGYLGAAMLELTAADQAHDRNQSDPAAPRQADTYLQAARDAGVGVPDGISAWLAVEQAREALQADASPVAALRRARELIGPALNGDGSDVDAQFVARRTELELALAEVNWRARTGQPMEPALGQGLGLFEQLLAGAREFGDGRCDGAELLLHRVNSLAGAQARHIAGQAADHFAACIAASPFVEAHRQPRLQLVRRLAGLEP